ncbi:MAG: nucleotidyltransferase family protein [Chloroflexota bacterium]
MGSPTVAALLLAAGASSRMGHPKQLLPWMGTTLIAYQVEQLIQAGARPIVVVLGAEAKRVAIPLRHFPGVTLVSNPLYALGKSTSIHAGLRGLQEKFDALLLLAVDQPRRADTLRRLISEHLERGSLITVPVYRGRRGHPPVLSAALLQQLDSLTEEQQGLREVMARHHFATAEVPVDSPEVLLDLNTPEEYHAALAFFEKPTSTA